MKIPILLIILTIVFSCHEKKDDSSYLLAISDNYYTCDLKTGIFRIAVINFMDTVHLTEIQKNKIDDAFYKFHIDTLTGEKKVLPKKIMIMPDFGNKININAGNGKKSVLYISNQLSNEHELSEVEHNIFEFKENLLEILNENSDYKSCMDTLKSNYKKLPPEL